ncbi:Extracellular solute-binding protein, partial [Pseudomonas syringae pv. solidagae]
MRVSSALPVCQADLLQRRATDPACRPAALRLRAGSPGFLISTCNDICPDIDKEFMRMKARPMKMLTVAMLAACSLAAGVAEAAGVLTIGRREDGTTFDPIKSAQNIDNWVFSNVYDVLIRVDDKGTKLVPGLAESWSISPDGLTYTLKMRPAKFSDGSDLTASDAVFSLLRIRDDKGSLWSDSYKIIDKAIATDPHTLVITLKNPSASFLSQLALPNVSILSEKAMKSMGEEAYAEQPVSSGAFTVKEWRRGDRVILAKNPNFWEAPSVSLDGVEWISVPDDNTRTLMVQKGELDAAIWIPFSRIENLQKDPDLVVHLDPSTREDHLLINHEHGALAKPEVRQALDM